ncbi:RNA polymerase sigma factor [Agrococcus jejuensis]|uniref:RNA polymerase sigma factor n=1 Tax=Agrococcus jejuensis TaxID=399736 RepID=UPI0011A92775|nr:sigma-70 family RNA polymerase sigma factor [Agrococcus jejuensis]
MTLPPFDRVVQQHGPTVYRVVRAVVGPSDADDAWSDAFLAALEAYPRLDAEANVAGWLVTIAHRKAIDVLRRSSRSLSMAEVPDRAAPHRDPDLDLRRALAALPDRQRSCVVLHHLGGLPFDEVAASLGVSSTAARKASSDGVRRLRALLEAGDE